MPNTACFQVSRLSLLYRTLVLLLLTAIGVLLLAILVPIVVSGQDYLVGALLLLWGLALLHYWVFLLSMPNRIHLEEGGSLRLSSLFRTMEIDCSEIVAFRVSPIHQSYLKIVTAKKTFTMINHVDGLHDLIDRIKRANPDLETKGC